MDNQFSVVFSTAVQRRRLTLDVLSRTLRDMGTPVSIATLSYWQTGRSLPSRARSLRALRNLERVLEVAPGHLARALPGITDAELAEPDTSLTTLEAVRGTLGEMGLTTSNELHNLTLQDSMTLSADETLQRRVTRQLVRAMVDGVDRLPVVLMHSDAEGCPVPNPELQTGLGCRLGRVQQVPTLELMVAELLLPKVLAKGDVAMFDYATLWPTDTHTEPGFQRFLTATTHFLLLDVTFEGRGCRSANYVHGPAADTLSQDLERTPLVPGRHVQHVLRHAPSGLHGLEWVPRTSTPPA